MLFNEAYAELKKGKYMRRAGWVDTEFAVLFPQVAFIWKIVTDPVKPNAGVWMASVQDLDADDWMEMPKEIIPDHVCDAPVVDAA